MMAVDAPLLLTPIPRIATTGAWNTENAMRRVLNHE